jgi:hypothetical protein
VLDDLLVDLIQSQVRRHAAILPRVRVDGNHLGRPVWADHWNGGPFRPTWTSAFIAELIALDKLFGRAEALGTRFQ